MTSNKQFIEAQSFFCNSSAWPLLKNGIEQQIKANWERIFVTVDKSEMDRIIGGNEALTTMIKNIDSAPEQLLALAKGESATGIQLND